MFSGELCKEDLNVLIIMQWAKFSPVKNPLSQTSDPSPVILCHKKNPQIILTDLEVLQTTAEIARVDCRGFYGNIY